MTNLLLYENIEALNREAHKTLKLQQPRDSAFAAHAHIAPLAGMEFLHAARHYPILFIGEAGQEMPIALLGLEEGHNAYIDEKQQWRRNHYIPAFVRRYPFVMAQESNEKLTVCIDAAYPGWNRSEGVDLFTEDGQNTEYLNNVIQFMEHFTQEMERTRHFVALMAEWRLLESRSMTLTHPEGDSFTLNNFLIVNEEAFLALSDDKLVEIKRAGYLAWVYAHLMSLGNANDLFEDYVTRK